MDRRSPPSSSFTARSPSPQATQRKQHTPVWTFRFGSEEQQRFKYDEPCGLCKVFCRYQGNLAHPAEAGPVSCAFGIAVVCKPAAFDRRDLLDAFHRRASSARHIDALYEAGHTTSLLAAKCPESLCPNDRRGLVTASRGPVLICPCP